MVRLSNYRLKKCAMFAYYLYIIQSLLKSEYFQSHLFFEELRKNGLVFERILNDIDVNIEHNWFRLIAFSFLHLDELIYWELKDNIVQKLFEWSCPHYNALAYPHIQLIQLFYWNKNIWELLHRSVASWHCSFLMNCQSF